MCRQEALPGASPRALDHFLAPIAFPFPAALHAAARTHARTHAGPHRSMSRAAGQRQGTVNADADAGSADSAAPQWVLAVLPARGHGRQVGLVALESDAATVAVSHVAADSPTWVRTLHFARSKPPAVVLLPATALAAPPPTPAPARHGDDDDIADPQVAVLVKALRVNFPLATLVPVMRKYWNEQASRARLAAAHSCSCSCSCFRLLMSAVLTDLCARCPVRTLSTVSEQEGEPGAHALAPVAVSDEDERLIRPSPTTISLPLRYPLPPVQATST